MARAKPSPDNKQIARHLAAAFGGNPQVAEYLHDTESLTVNILWCDDRPRVGLVSYSTITLSDYELFDVGGVVFPVRVELAGLCSVKESAFANVLASAAFCMMRSRRLYTPGSVLPDYVKEYFPSTTVPHLYLTAPFVWVDTLTTLNCATKTVTWLLAMPISEPERRLLESSSDDDLESLLEQEGADISDLYRTSVV